jgi:hypothetical protein
MVIVPAAVRQSPSCSGRVIVQPRGKISVIDGQSAKDAELQALKQTVAELKAAFDQLGHAKSANSVTR